MQSVLSEELTRFFDKEKRDYSSFTALKSRISKRLSEITGSTITTKTPQQRIRDLIGPALGPEYTITKKARTLYLVRGSMTGIVIRYLKAHPDTTLKQAYRYMPFSREEFAGLLNTVIDSGDISVRITPQAKDFGLKFDQKPVQSKGTWKEEIRTAYARLSRGRSYITVYELRRDLNWPRPRFDAAIQGLWEEGTVELQASSQNLLTDDEREDSYRDRNDTLRILLFWRGS
jgi:hypothetical protein